MVGLSVVLEPRNCNSTILNEKTPQVISKATLMINKPPSSPTSFPSPTTTFRLPTFLEHCFLCRQKLLPAKDIYMYKGDRAFCSVECRCKQIFMDEEETVTVMRDNCSLTAVKPTPATSTASSHGSRCRKTPRETERVVLLIEREKERKESV